MIFIIFRAARTNKSLYLCRYQTNITPLIESCSTHLSLNTIWIRALILYSTFEKFFIQMCPKIDIDCSSNSIEKQRAPYMCCYSSVIYQYELLLHTNIPTLLRKVFCLKEMQVAWIWLRKTFLNFQYRLASMLFRSCKNEENNLSFNALSPFSGYCN